MKRSLFVEGPSDQAFVRSLLERLGIDAVRVEVVHGSVSKLPVVANQLRRRRDEGARVAVLLDADSSARAQRRLLEKAKDQHDLPIDRAFFLPDDESPGDLETLLVQIAASPHDAVHRCFDGYEECLDGLGGSYSKPNRKGRIYAYCEALGVETRPAVRRYGDSRHWNLDAPCLDRLKRFLRGLAECGEGTALGHG